MTTETVSNMTLALQLLGQGMLGIFVVLGVIALLVVLMQKLDQSSGKRK